MNARIIDYKGYTYWLDVKACVIFTYLCSGRGCIKLQHPAFGVDESIQLTDFMDEKELKLKHSSFMPVDLTIDFSQ